MDGKLHAWMLILSWVLCSGIAWSQDPAPNAQPGGNYRGQHIGFAPRYGRVHPPQSRSERIKAANAAPSGRVSNRSTSSSSVTPAEYTGAAADIHPVPDGHLLPEGEVIYDQGGFADGHPMLDEGTFDAWPASYLNPLVWARADYLLWWTDGMDVPALATTSPAGTLQDEAGVLGLRNTSILFGNETLNDASRGGGRFTIGRWLDACESRGIELTYLGLEEESQTFAASNAGFPILARPFQDAQSDAQDARLINFPNLVEGSLAIHVSTDFQTAELLFRRPTRSFGWSRVDGFVGYRFAELEDMVSITESTESLSGPTDGTAFELSDRFDTRNQFHGGQVGVRAVSRTPNNWSMEFLGKLALGSTRSKATLAGETFVQSPTGATSTQPAGLLVQSSNRGTFESNEFSTIIELGVSLRRHFGANWAASFGYNFLLWTDVVRAGDQVDTQINVSQIPPGTLVGESRPAYTANTSDFWAQGLSFGLEFNY